MTLNRIISKLNPGDKFIYKDNLYLLIKTTPVDLGCSADTANYVCALDLSTFEIMCFDRGWEVNISGAESYSEAGTAVSQLWDTVDELYAREISNNCPHVYLRKYSWDQLCDTGIQLLQKLKGV